MAQLLDEPYNFIFCPLSISSFSMLRMEVDQTWGNGGLTLQSTKVSGGKYIFMIIDSRIDPKQSLPCRLRCVPGEANCPTTESYLKKRESLRKLGFFYENMHDG